MAPASIVVYYPSLELISTSVHCCMHLQRLYLRFARKARAASRLQHNSYFYRLVFILLTHDVFHRLHIAKSVFDL